MAVQSERRGPSPFDALRHRAHELIPGGAHTYSKDDEHFSANTPPFILSGCGAYVQGSDGERYLDWGMGLRSVILGHAYPPVLEAVRVELEKGSNFTRPSPIEARLAELLVSLIPCAEMVKFGKNGSDATTAAVRLARAHTGRQKILVCDGSFHASDDWWLSSQPLSAGTVEQGTAVFPFNDAPFLRDALRGRDVAAVIMEPTAFTSPEPGYLAAVRRACSDTGTVLIFDEIITGFRFHVSGAQHLFGVTPDLATFGKAMANGFSVSALVGQRDLMMTPGVHLLSATHGGETHALAAALATITELQRHNVPEHLTRIGKRLQTGLRAIGYDVRGAPMSPNVVFETDRRWPRRDFSGGPSPRPPFAPEVYTGTIGPQRLAFQSGMVDRTILAPYWAPSFAHTDEDVDITLAAAGEIFASLS